jgi:hypothetical protein
MAIHSKLASTDLMGFALGSPLFLGAATLLIIIFIRFLLNRPKKLNLPIVGEPREKDYREALVEGTKRVFLIY